VSGQSVCKQQVDNGRNAAAARKRANKDDPFEKKKGIILQQSVWPSIRGSLQKFGIANLSNYFDLFMELPEMHARIHDLEMYSINPSSTTMITMPSLGFSQMQGSNGNCQQHTLFHMIAMTNTAQNTNEPKKYMKQSGININIKDALQ